MQDLPKLQQLPCGHVGTIGVGNACCHLLASQDGDYIQRFTGNGRQHDLICGDCYHRPEEIDANLRQVCSDCWERLPRDRCWEGILGQPQILKKDSPLRFRHESVTLPISLHDVIDLQPLLSESGSVWLALTTDGRILRFDLDHNSVQPLTTLPDSPINLTTCSTLQHCDWEQLGDSRGILARRDQALAALHLSACGRVAAVVQPFGRYGLIIELATGRPTLNLDRGDYHEDVSQFPIAFTQQQDRLLVIQGTEWNRLDISDALSGEVLTSRMHAPTPKDKSHPEHYHDYFHCGLTVSPSGEFIADNGWAWSPFGVLLTWSLHRWLRENVWESEDGTSLRRPCQRAYYWDGPLCWLNDTQIAVFGYGEDDEWLIPAACIYDAPSGKLVRWFPGPQGRFVYDDGLLFSSHPEKGTTVWDVVTGEQIAHDPCCFQRYHPRAKVFVTLRPDSMLRVSRLETTNVI